MYTLILSKHGKETSLLQNLLDNEGCAYKALSLLSSLEREIRIKFPDFLLIDSTYFINEQANVVSPKNKSLLHHSFFFTDIIFPISICFPIYFFNRGQIEFKEYYASEYHKSIAPQNNEIIVLLTHIKGKMNDFFYTTQNQFRPAEKKLYSLLKATENQCISLEQMSHVLWGCSNIAHKKTLYSYIHRMKHILENTEYPLEWLIKDKKGCYKLAIRKIENANHNM